MGCCIPRIPHFDKTQRQTLMKWMSLAFVVVFVVHGLVNLGVSVWLELYNVPACGFLSSSLAPVHILIAAGGSIVLVCVATVLYNRRYRQHGYFRSFTCILLMVITFEISSAVAAAIVQHRLDNGAFYKDMQRHLKGDADNGDVTAGSREAHRKCWHDLQRKYKCCGLTGLNDLLGANKTGSNASAWQTNRYTAGCQCSGTSNCVNSGGPYPVYSDGCYGVLNDMLGFVCLFTRIFGPVFGGFQAIAYIIMHCIFTKLSRGTIISVYKPKGSEVSLGETYASP